MNIRGKSSPVQSNIRTVTNPAGGPTPPPIRGGHFDESQHFQPHFSGPGVAYQPPQSAYVDMNKPAGGRVSGPALGGGPQSFNVPRAQPVRASQQGYNPIVDQGQDQSGPQMSWNAPQQSSYYMQAANQNVRQPRMPGMNNGQVPGVGMTSFMASMPFIPGGMPPNYNGSQPLQYMQNQFVQYPPQQRLPYPPAAMPQQQQINFMQQAYGPAGSGYPTYYQAPMQMPNTSRPSSAGPGGAVGGAPMQQQRNRRRLQLTDPKTGEDITDKVFKAQQPEESDAQRQEQAYHEAVTMEFARKVARLATGTKDQDPEDVPQAEQTPTPPLAAEAPFQPAPAEETPQQAAIIMEPPSSAHSMPAEPPHIPVMNGEPEQNIEEPVLRVEPEVAPHTTEVERPPSPMEPVETVAAAAAPDVETPSPAQAASPPVLPPAEPEVPASVTPPAKEVTPPPPAPTETVVPPAVTEKEPSPPVEKVEEPSPASPLQATTISAADAVKLIGETSVTPPPADAKPPQASAPQPQRQDGRKGKKKRDYNKKTKEGSDMDAFYDTQVSQEATPAAAPEQPAEAAPAPVQEVEAPAAATTEAAPPAAAVEEAPAAEPAPPAATPAVEDPSPAPLSPPVVKIEGAAEEEKEPAPEENGVEAEGDQAERARPRILNGVQLDYKEGQWSPQNPEGKKQYDREFLLKLQANPESRKVPNLPDFPELLIDPRSIKTEDFQKAQALAASRSVPDFTPGFFKSYPRSGGPGSMTKRGSQQNRRGGQNSSEQRIIPSLRQEVTLHKSENAYKPMFQKDTTGDGEDKETKALLRKFTSILNKLTPEKYEKLSADVLTLTINTEERLTSITDLLFEKAISEVKFSAQYAYLCRDMLKLPKVVKADKTELTFRAVLLTKCQKEFEKDTLAEGYFDKKRRELEAANADKKTLAELEESATKARKRSTGNIRFIGELFRLKMLTENIMHDCIFKLLKTRDDESIECLCNLLETIGQDLDTPKAKVRMDQYFQQFEKMTADLKREEELGITTRESVKDAQANQSSKKDSSKPILCSRVKFNVLDIIDLRKNNWVKRRIKTENKPTTLGEIHQKAKQEQQEQQYLNSQPRMLDPNPSRGGTRGKGRGSMQGDSDGWNTVPAKPVRQQIDATKMKITKTNVDETTLTLGGGNKFQNWGRGSQGGGSRSQEQERGGNRYNALNNLNDNDGRRGYGRSPARGDSRSGSSRMGGDRDRRDRDRDMRRPVARSSMEERERALASTRNILGGSGPSNPSSRNTSRDNSRSRDVPARAQPPKVPSGGVDATAMDRDELDRRLNTIAEELHGNLNVKEAKESIVELMGLDYVQLVTTLLEKLVEKPPKTRHLLGQLLMMLVADKIITTADLIKGIAELLQFADDLELDIPKIWDYLADIFSELVLDNKVLPLRFLRECLQSVKGKAGMFVQKVFKVASEVKSREVVQAQWAASGLRFADFDLNESSSGFELGWLKGPSPNMVSEGVRQHLRNKASNEEVFKWIDKNFRKEETESSQFVRELMSAICRMYIIGHKQLDPEGLKLRIPLLRKYLDSQEKGTEALFAVQHLMCELEHPPGLVRNLFDLLYDEDIISEESFFAWEQKASPKDDVSGRGVVKLNLREFFDWLRSSNEDERRS